MVVQLCRHCGVKPVSKGRGLCYRCGVTPAVLDLYPPVTFPEVGVGNHQRQSPAEPTDARPGSPEKLAVLIERAEREELLWHENDARLNDAA